LSLPAGIGFGALPPKVEATCVTYYNVKSSPNQHIYYVQSQIVNVIDKDVIVARLYIGTLKGFVFDWFKRCPSGSINS